MCAKLRTLPNDESKGRSYSPKGKTPIQKVNPVPEKINMISAISNQGKVHFMFYKDTMTVQKLIEFMERIISCNERKVFLILDNLRVHHSKLLDDFLRELRLTPRLDNILLKDWCKSL